MHLRFVRSEQIDVLLPVESDVSGHFIDRAGGDRLTDVDVAGDWSLEH